MNAIRFMSCRSGADAGALDSVQSERAAPIYSFSISRGAFVVVDRSVLCRVAKLSRSVPPVCIDT